MEENPVEGSKTKLIIVLLIVIILVIASLGIYLMGGGASGITAMEGREIADDIAKNWSINATLTGIQKSSNMDGDGRFNEWVYFYIDEIIITNTTKRAYIGINIDGTSSVRYSTVIVDCQPIGAFAIDSDKAYEIANDSSAIKSFLLHRPVLDIFSLGNSTGTPTWYIEWGYGSLIDGPQWARIEIDANTGEVLYVNADN